MYKSLRLTLIKAIVEINTQKSYEEDWKTIKINEQRETYVTKV